MNIGKMLKSKAVQNGMWLYVLQLFNTVIPLITLPYITRILGAAEYGVFSIAFNLIGYFQVVVEFGFAMSGARKASLSKGIDELHKTFTAIMLSRLLLCFLCFFAALGYSSFFMHSKKQSFCLVLLFLIPLGTVFQQTWVFQGLQKMQYITITSVISRIVSLICIFTLVKDKNDLALYCICYSITTVLIGAIGTFLAITKLKLRLVKITVQDVIEEIKSGWYVFTTSLSAKIFSTFGVTILGIMATEYEVGIYSAIQKIPGVIMLAWFPIGQVLYPISSKRMTESYIEGRKYVKNIRNKIVPVFLFGIICVALPAKLIVEISFGKEYVDYFYILYPLLAWVLLGILNNFKGIQVLLAGGYSKEYSKCFQVGVLSNVVLDIVLIKFFRLIGAALAVAISELILSVLLSMEIFKLDKRFCEEKEKEDTK